MKKYSFEGRDPIDKASYAAFEARRKSIQEDQFHILHSLRRSNPELFQTEPEKPKTPSRFITTYQSAYGTTPKPSIVVSVKNKTTATKPIEEIKVKKTEEKKIIQPNIKEEKKMPIQTLKALKNVLYAEDLLADFLDIAQKNTDKDIETCGVLCGIEKDMMFFITEILIPKQKGSCDTCTTIDYEEIFAYMSKRKLLTLGWIHTHPSYVFFYFSIFKDAFLSSIDLHTQFSYQKLMPESIAIVYSGIAAKGERS